MKKLPPNNKQAIKHKKNKQKKKKKKNAPGNMKRHGTKAGKQTNEGKT